MNLAAADRIVNALLYEGYMLYPYRASAVKNQQRFNFGVLYPPLYAQAIDSEPCFSQTECVLNGSGNSTLEVRVRFLQLMQRSIYKCPSKHSSERRIVDRLEVDGQIFQTWQEAVEREICIPPISVHTLLNSSIQCTTDFPASDQEEEIQALSGECVGVITRSQQALRVLIEARADTPGDGVFKINIRIKNVTSADSNAGRDSALLQSTISTHTILGADEGEFVSQLDPPASMRAVIETCQNIGAFPVLVGTSDKRHTMLSSPIILYDYPEIAAESAGDLFDATEIDEILSLRIMTLTEEEKREVRSSDARGRLILERTESMPEEQFMKLHGAARTLRIVQEPTE